MKKKYLFFLAIIFTIFFVLIVGCKQVEQQKEPAIKEPQLTDNEKELLRLVGVERYFVFDINLSQINFERLEFRVDRYHQGKLKDTISYGSIKMKEAGQGQQRLIWSQIKRDNLHEELSRISFMGYSLTNELALSDEFMGLSSAQRKIIETVNIGEDIMLAAIVGINEGPLESPETIFLETDEAGINSLKLYDVAYVLTVVFHED